MTRQRMRPRPAEDGDMGEGSDTPKTEKDRARAAEKENAIAQPPQLMRVGDRDLAISPVTFSVNRAIVLEVNKVIGRRKSALSRLVEDPAWSELPEPAKVAAAAKATEEFFDREAELPDGWDLLMGLAEPAVLAFAIWACAHRNHPDLTLEWLREQVTEANTSALHLAFMEASGMGGNPEGNAAGPPGSSGV